MKLGVLTFHCAHNYGAVLQCFGLQEYLKSLGHEVYVIDYRPRYITLGYQKHSWRDWICSSPALTLQKFIHEPYLWNVRERRYNNFKAFIEKKLNLYPYRKGMDFSEFDAIFLGSDQIWEAPITGGKFDEVFFGTRAKCKVISYAASNKAKQLSESEIEFYKKHLATFTGIGVRESTFQKLLSQIMDKPVVLNVDPTLLAGGLLNNGIEDKRLVTDKYVLIYEIVEHRKVIQLAREYAQRVGARVIMLSAYIGYLDTDIRDQEASPADFVNYIRHAECVFTTSFHGTAISILCQTQFYSFRQHNSSDLRLESLLSLISLQDRFIEMSGKTTDSRIDYQKVLTQLEIATLQSKEFIQKTLE